jgi:uncharacterized protein (DUF1786 family)
MFFLGVFFMTLLSGASVHSIANKIRGMCTKRNKLALGGGIYGGTVIGKTQETKGHMPSDTNVIDANAMACNVFNKNTLPKRIASISAAKRSCGVYSSSGNN